MTTLKRMCEEAGRDFNKIEISVVLMQPDTADPKGLFAQYEDAGCHRLLIGNVILPPGGEGYRVLERIAKDYIN